MKIVIGLVVVLAILAFIPAVASFTLSALAVLFNGFIAVLSWSIAHWVLVAALLVVALIVKKLF